MEQKQRLTNVLFYGLQNFDLAREVDKVLEFVSPNEAKWKVLTDQEGDLHRNISKHDKNMTVKQQTRIGEKIRVRNMLRRNPKMLEMHRLLLNCDNHAQKGEMQQSLTKL